MRSHAYHVWSKPPNCNLPASSSLLHLGPSDPVRHAPIAYGEHAVGCRANAALVPSIRSYLVLGLSCVPERRRTPARAVKQRAIQLLQAMDPWNAQHYSYNPQNSTADRSTAYQPVNTGPISHISHSGVKYEDPNQPTVDVVAIEGRSQPLGFRSIRWWIVELLASVITVVSFIAIIYVVRYYRGQGVEEVHLPTGLSLNGLVALLSTVCRVALMIPVASVLSQEVWTWLYARQRGTTNRRQLRDLTLSDEASRGAWGSFKFLLQARRNWLSYVASLVTLVALAFGTFTQQLLTIRPFAISLPALTPGAVPRSEWWNAYVGRPSEGVLQPPLSIKGAAYNGILTSSVQPVTIACPTGNCTWPVTPSLAVCGACVNSTWELNCEEGDSGKGQVTDMCQYTMPSGEIGNVTNLKNVGEGIGFTVFPSTGHVYDTSRTDIAYIANFEAVGAPNGSLSSWYPADNASTVASECALWMCLQAYETKQVNAAQTQSVVGEYYTVDNTSYIEYTDNITFVNIPSNLNSIGDQQYQIEYPAYMALRQYFGALFVGNMTLNQEQQQPSSDVIAGTWNSSTDMDTWIKSVAAGMSTVVRESGLMNAAAASYYQGTASQLGYDVRWPWIILPGISVGLSLMCLMVIIVRTARSPVRAWKGSPLTMLFTDVDPYLRQSVAGVTDQFEGIEDAVGRTGVMLEDRGHGRWSIRAT